MNDKSVPEPNEKYNILAEAASIVSAAWGRPRSQLVDPVELVGWLCHSCLLRSHSGSSKCRHCGTARGEGV